MRKRFYLLLIFMFLSLVACSSRNEVPEVRIGHAPHDHHATLYVAAVKGEYFRKQSGVYLKPTADKKKYQLYKNNSLLANIIIDSCTGGIQLIRKLDEKILDISFGGVPAIIEMIDRGSHIKMLAPVMTEGAALVVSNDMPVSDWDEFTDYITSSERPLRIGYKVDVSVQNLIFETALSKEKISFSKDIEDKQSDVILLNLHGPKNLIPALEADIIDGFVVMQPFPSLAEQRKAGKIIAQLSSLPPEGRWQNHPCCALAAGEDFISKHQEITEALIRLFAAAGEYISKNPADAAQITAEWLGTPVQVENDSIPTIHYLSNFTGEWDRGVNFWVSSLIEKGLLSGKIMEAYGDSRLEDTLYDKKFYRELKAGKNN